MSDIENATKDPGHHQEEGPNKRHKPDASEAAGPSTSSIKGKFKIVGRVVMAMRRFQGRMPKLDDVWDLHSQHLGPVSRSVTGPPRAGASADLLMSPDLQHPSTPPTPMASAAQMALRNT
jgi:hypothetical protein